MNQIELISIKPASAKSKEKYTAEFRVDGKVKRVSFGERGYEDYTIHHDGARRDRYRARHAHTMMDTSILSPAALSWYILWGESTNLATNITNYKEQFCL